MLYKRIAVFGLFFVLFLAGCRQAETPAPTPTLTPSPTAIPQPTSTQTNTPSPTSPAPINYLVDVEDALIQIEAQGKFFSPKFAPVSSDPGRGSGFIIDPDGIAITTNHAVAGADQIKVRVGKDGSQTYDAKVIATSECADLAVIDIEGGPFDFLSYSPDPAQVGQKVYVAGYQLVKPNYTIASGNVKSTKANGNNISGADNLLMEYDIALEAGMSGGPVLTPEGKVLGIHYTGDSENNKAFGIAIGAIKPTLDALLEGQDVESIGINAQPVQSEDGSLAGLWVFAVQPGSLASQVGIQGGESVTRLSTTGLNSEQIPAQFCEVLRNWDLKAPLAIQVYRINNGTLMEGQLKGSKLAEVSNQVFGIFQTPESGTPAALNLKAQKSGEVYYLEEFDAPLTNWNRFVLQGDEKKVETDIKDSKLQVTIDSLLTYLYYTYKPLKVTDVRLQLKSENLGRNNNNISLVCRYSLERGWYEFNFASNGLFWVKRYDPRFHNYFDIGKGASRLINMGQGTNEYGVVCKDNQLTLFINGKEVKTYTDNTLVTGQAGFSISSFTVTPINVALDSFKVSVP